MLSGCSTKSTPWAGLSQGAGRVCGCPGEGSLEEREASSTPGSFRRVQVREGLLTPAELLHRGQAQRQGVLSLLMSPVKVEGLMQRRMQRKARRSQGFAAGHLKTGVC